MGQNVTCTNMTYINLAKSARLLGRTNYNLNLMDMTIIKQEELAHKIELLNTSIAWKKRAIRIIDKKIKAIDARIKDIRIALASLLTVIIFTPFVLGFLLQSLI